MVQVQTEKALKGAEFSGELRLIGSKMLYSSKSALGTSINPPDK